MGRLLMKYRVPLFAVATIVVLSATMLFAQTPPPSPTPPAPPGAEVTWSAVSALIQAAGILVAPWLGYAFAVLLCRGVLPRAVLVFLPIALGYVATNLPTWLTGLPPVWGPAATIVAVATVRELLTTLERYGLKGGGGDPGGLFTLFGKIVK